MRDACITVVPAQSLPSRRRGREPRGGFPRYAIDASPSPFASSKGLRKGLIGRWRSPRQSPSPTIHHPRSTSANHRVCRRLPITVSSIQGSRPYTIRVPLSEPAVCCHHASRPLCVNLYPAGPDQSTGFVAGCTATILVHTAAGLLKQAATVQGKGGHNDEAGPRRPHRHRVDCRD